MAWGRYAICATASSVMAVSEFHTAGEILVDRALCKETRSGVAHFVSGQHGARRVGITAPFVEMQAELTYVDVMGHAVFVQCVRAGGTWRPIMLARAGQIHTFQPCLASKAGFELSDTMIETLRGVE